MTEEIGKYLEEYTYEHFLNEALSHVPEGIDSREGSIIFDALSPACYQLAEFIYQLKVILLETYVQTASGSYLDYRAEEAGISRIAATNAIVKGKFIGTDNKPLSLAIGDRFSSIGNDPIYYRVIAPDDELGAYRLRAESAGTNGNEYIGQLLPLSHLNGLSSATLTEILIPSRDVETDDELRKRIILAKEVVSFGGNIQDYINLTMGINGVGAVQVYPVWDGGGTVRLVILNNSFKIASVELLDSVQQLIDPTKNGKGIGYAPIGHIVTVATPLQKQITISFSLMLNSGIALEQVKDRVVEAIERYFDETRKKWGNINSTNSYECWVFRSQISAAILTVAGVANVQNLTLNGKDEDIEMTLSNSKQELPILGVVTIV